LKEIVLGKEYFTKIDYVKQNICSLSIKYDFNSNITDSKGNVHDSKKLGPMIREIDKNENYTIDKVYGDKAHDNRRSFNLLDDMNIEPVISLRKNASTKTRACLLRRDESLLIRKLGYDKWKQLKDAGKRWIAEIVFSSIKRVLGDLLSKKFSAQKVEAGLKVMLYNKFISL
jgi:hypothetical protein